MIERNVYKDWIRNQVLNRFGRLIFDNGEDTVMCCHDNMYWKKLCQNDMSSAQAWNPRCRHVIIEAKTAQNISARQY